MNDLYTIKVNCPHCGKAFETFKVRYRRSVPYKIDSDFCPYYKEGDSNPHFYYAKVCPDCGFAFTDEFSENFPLGTKELINAKITAGWRKKEFGQARDVEKAIESLKLAIYSATLKKEKHSVLGGLCLRLAWIYRTANRQESQEEEERFLKLALQEYEEAYLHSDFKGTSLSELNVLFLIGELSRRLGQFSKAISYFSKIAEHPRRYEEAKILDRARKQWKITAEQNREQREHDSKA
ncbi:DUF2225 domain-containing protein [Desulfosporosinus sp. PR]|uniref:DUF2225 domain-containing protein n=1 Tax=Candidatus Desulfosporosinus nitrosoreducens TaxID=3401928 RepID=UPI0027E8DB78|nr:DUF2225 domain-containing protein [Desulfosporosinus sp. PR]MDQ7094785.1 DUF2225 domain-containing protein [Desulfosporosinus sp. PR]